MNSKINKYLSSYPELIAEWHPTKNGDLEPIKFKHKSNKVVWWKCPAAPDHEWKASIYSRTNGNGCGFCAGRKASSTYNLKLTHPDIAEDWHPTKNGCLKPENVTKGSHQSVFWQCKTVAKHVYSMTVGNRVAGKNCSFCSGQKVHHTNSLLTHFPELAKEWHPTKNGTKTPSDFTKSSSAKVWWKCPKGDDHEWDDKIKNRTINKQGCACCSGKRVCRGNSAVLLRPNLQSEWHPTKNGNEKLEDYTVFSNKVFWWKCIRKHEWQAPISSRSNGYGCDKCSPKTSRPEIRIFSELSALFDDCCWRYKINGVELDIYLPLLNVGLEYDGHYWHNNSKKYEKDIRKNNHFEELGINLIRIRTGPLKLLGPNDLAIDNISLSKSDINQIFTKIKSLIELKYHSTIDHYIELPNFINHSGYLSSVANISMPPEGKSLADKYPAIAKYWDQEKNAPSTPEHFSCYSKENVFWRCPNVQNHSWSATVSNMKRKTTNICPFCSKKRPSPEYNLAKKFPNVAAQWHPTANGALTPTEVTHGSDKKYYWLINDVKYQRSIASMVRSFKRLNKNLKTDKNKN